MNYNCRAKLILLSTNYYNFYRNTNNYILIHHHFCKQLLKMYKKYFILLNFYKKFRKNQLNRTPWKINKLRTHTKYSETLICSTMFVMYCANVLNEFCRYEMFTRIINTTREGYLTELNVSPTKTVFYPLINAVIYQNLYLMIKFKL